MPVRVSGCYIATHIRIGCVEDVDFRRILTKTRFGGGARGAVHAAVYFGLNRWGQVGRSLNFIGLFSNLLASSRINCVHIAYEPSPI